MIAAAMMLVKNVPMSPAMDWLTFVPASIWSICFCMMSSGTPLAWKKAI